MSRQEYFCQFFPYETLRSFGALAPNKCTKFIFSWSPVLEEIFLLFTGFSTARRLEETILAIIHTYEYYRVEGRILRTQTCPTVRPIAY